MKKALKIILNVVIWLFVVFAACLTIIVFSSQYTKSGLPSIFGNMPISITTGSMENTLNIGDLIISKELDTEEKKSLKKDDIITYFADLDGDANANEINTHRIVDTFIDGGYTYYETKGDNNQTNPVADKTPVRYDLVIGKYSNNKIPFLGSVLSYLQTQTGFLICIVLPLIIFFLFELYRFIIVIVASKGKKALTAEEEDVIKQKAIEEYLKQQEKNIDKEE
ncbi:MAG: signal peptidase I, partial [Clostridia bacterium]